MRIRVVWSFAFAAAALVALPGCDPNGDFVFGAYDFAEYRAVLDASSKADGTDAHGTFTLDGTLFGYVKCLRIEGSTAVIGLDLSPSIGLTAWTLVSDVGPPGTDVIRLSPTGIDAADVCDLSFEPGPPALGSFVVRDV